MSWRALRSHRTHSQLSVSACCYKYFLQHRYRWPVIPPIQRFSILFVNRPLILLNNKTSCGFCGHPVGTPRHLLKCPQTPRSTICKSLSNQTPVYREKRKLRCKYRLAQSPAAGLDCVSLLPSGPTTCPLESRGPYCLIRTCRALLCFEGGGAVLPNPLHG